MAPDAELFLPGTVETGDPGSTLEWEGTTVPVADPGDRLAAVADGARCTLGLAVDIADVRAVADADHGGPPTGIGVADGGLELVGDKHRVGFYFGKGRQKHFFNLVFGPGIWPVARDGGLRQWARPFDEREGERDSLGGPDRLAMAVDRLTVASVLTGESDPYGDALTDPRFESRPHEATFRFSVGDRQLWPSDGWYEDGRGSYRGVQRVLVRIGRALEDRLSEGSVADPDWEHDGQAWDHPDVAVRVDGDRTTLRCKGTLRPVGPWPAEGLRFDTDALLRAWLRDARAFLEVRDDDDLADVYRSVRDLADVDSV